MAAAPKQKVNAYRYLGMKPDVGYEEIVRRWQHFYDYFNVRNREGVTEESLRKLAAYILIYEDRKLPPPYGAPAFFAQDRLNDADYKELYKPLGLKAPVRDSEEVTYELPRITSSTPDVLIENQFKGFVSTFDKINREEITEKSLEQLAAFILLYEKRGMRGDNDNLFTSPVHFANDRLSNEHFEALYKILDRLIPARADPFWIPDEDEPLHALPKFTHLVITPVSGKKALPDNYYAPVPPPEPPAEVVSPPPSDPSASLEFERTPPTRSHRGWIVPAIGLVVAGGIGVAVWQAYHGAKPPLHIDPPPPDPKTAKADTNPPPNIPGAKGAHNTPKDFTQPPPIAKNVAPKDPIQPKEIITPKETIPPKTTPPPAKIEIVKGDLAKTKAEATKTGTAVRQLFAHWDNTYSTQFGDNFDSVTTLASKGAYSEAINELDNLLKQGKISQQPNLNDTENQVLTTILKDRADNDDLIMAMSALNGKKPTEKYNGNDFKRLWQSGIEKYRGLLNDAKALQQSLGNPNPPPASAPSRR